MAITCYNPASSLLAAAISLWDLSLLAGLFVSVFLLVLAVFSQGGTIQLSPQREAALASGHSDRRTVFENAAFKPIMWILLAISHRLAMPRAKAWIQRKLVAAGSPNYYTPEEYLALSLFVGVVVAFVLELADVMVTGRFGIATIIIGMAAGVGVSVYQLHNKATKRIRLISKRIPYSLDLIALAMGAGATFTEAVRTVVRERGDDPFNEELRAVLAEIELGTTRRQALQNLSARVPLESLRSIVASIVQAEELGTPLAEVLHSQATLLRLHRSVRAENLAAIASVRMLIPSLLIMLSAVLAVFAPAILRALRKGLF